MFAVLTLEGVAYIVTEFRQDGAFLIMKTKDDTKQSRINCNLVTKIIPVSEEEATRLVTKRRIDLATTLPPKGIIQ